KHRDLAEICKKQEELTRALTQPREDDLPAHRSLMQQRADTLTALLQACDVKVATGVLYASTLVATAQSVNEPREKSALIERAKNAFFTGINGVKDVSAESLNQWLNKPDVLKLRTDLQIGLDAPAPAQPQPGGQPKQPEVQAGGQPGIKDN